AADPVAWVQPLRDELQLLPTIALFALRQNESLSKPGRVTLRAVDPRARDKAGVEVVIEAGAVVRRVYLDKTVPVVPVTFLKPFPAATRESELRSAFVDRYGRIVEATFAGGARILIAAGEREALADVGAVRRQGRRDPFDKMVAMRNAALERLKAE